MDKLWRTWSQAGRGALLGAAMLMLAAGGAGVSAQETAGEKSAPTAAEKPAASGDLQKAGPSGEAATGADAKDAPYPELLNKVIKAYGDIDHYEAVKKFKVTQSMGGQTQSQPAMEARVLFNRDAKQLRMEMDSLTAVLADGRFRMKVGGMEGKHLDMPMAGEPNLEAIAGVVGRAWVALVPPDVPVLLGDDPTAGLTPTNVAVEAPAEADAQKRQVLVLKSPSGDLRLSIDPKTSLITRSELNLSGEAMQGPPDMKVTVEFDLDLVNTTEPIPAERFAMDLEGSQAFSTIEEFVGMPKFAEPEELKGQPAPAFTLPDIDGKKVTLSEIKEKIVILDFWATWCGPCRQAMPKLQAVANWVKENKKPVAIYTVNLQETPEQAKAFLTEMKLTLPTLMDATGEVGQAYGAQAIPLTMVIADGKVAGVHVGMAPNMEELLKAEIDALLADGSAAAE